ncbi:MAG: hypothetical protein JWO58_2345 [Chitinophagaceae bacterium]|nr:hypothetical protein [Chitinophagaceae bacterium]
MKNLFVVNIIKSIHHLIMKKTVLFLFFCIGLPVFSSAQSLAMKRASHIGKGMNLSWLDQRWKGTEQQQHRDYVNLDDLPHYKAQIELIHKMGFQFLRFPVCFDLWYADKAPYELLRPSYYQVLDSIIKWTGEKNMLLSIDYHHGTLDNEHYQDQATRICFIWSEIARQYKHTDPERIFFELFNEPNRINESEWQETVIRIIHSVRKEAPHHTLIVGATKWNSLAALIEMPTLPDKNLIYTFHFYDPFLFTHQGASWTGDPTSTIGMPYPYRPKDMPDMDEKAQATWAKRLYESYPEQANYNALFTALQTASTWSKEHSVPVLCGEWGAYKKYAHEEDRCQYINDMYTILTQLHIPNAMWEWDAGFSFFQDEPAEDGVDDCLKKAMRLK